MPLKDWILRDGGPPPPPGSGGEPLDELLDPKARKRYRGEHARGEADRTSLLHAFRFLGEWLRQWGP